MKTVTALVWIGVLAFGAAMFYASYGWRMFTIGVLFGVVAASWVVFEESR